MARGNCVREQVRRIVGIVDRLDCFCVLGTGLAAELDSEGWLLLVKLSSRVVMHV